MSTYFSFTFESGRNTTTGRPNEKTGRMSIAGKVTAFASKNDRDASLDNNTITVTRAELRDFHLGMTIQSFNEMIDDEISMIGILD